MNKLGYALLLLGFSSGLSAQTTLNSPAGGVFPGTVSVVGGIVLDLVGTNNNRVVSQLAASSLYVGFSNDGFPVAYRGNPLTIGVQSGFTPGVISALGGGISKAAIRVTLWDGDTGPGDFDRHQNDFLLNGLNFGDWSNVTTIQHNSTGTSFGSTSTGFRNDTLDTGFFFTTDATLLSAFYDSLIALGTVTYALTDVDPADNFYDFTQGVDGGLIDIGQGPVVTPGNPSAVPEPSTYGLMGAGVLLGVALYRRRLAKHRASQS
jgi:hypothetical protein